MNTCLVPSWGSEESLLASHRISWNKTSLSGHSLWWKWTLWKSLLGNIRNKRNRISNVHPWEEVMDYTVYAWSDCTCNKILRFMQKMNSHLVPKCSNGEYLVLLVLTFLTWKRNDSEIIQIKTMIVKLYVYYSVLLQNFNMFACSYHY